MSVTNPNLGLQPGDVTRLRTARDIVAQIIIVWDRDPRYSSQVPELTAMRDGLDRLATAVEAYLVVQGT